VLQQENALVTVGTLNLQHDSINTIPGEVFFTIDMRHPVPAVLSGLDQNLRNLVEKVCREEKLEPEINLIWEAPTVTFDQECVGNVRDAAKSLGYSCQEIVSGAGHDACQMSHVVPTGMIFIPCKDGVSHNEIESAEPEHITSGANVLLHAMLKSAN
jgi:N-carbamoyl-L-amino-acid hydrolase